MTEREMQLQGLATEWRTMAYTWRDCALYALAVGATGEEPQYTYEKDMQVIPTFGVLPYWGAVNVTPQFPRPRAVPVLVEELLQPAQSYVNLDYEFLYHRPIPAGKGSFVYRDVLTDLFDRGEGRGMAVRSQVEVFDEGGVLLCTNRCTTLFPTLGGYGGQPMDRRASRIPDRAPDFVARDHGYAQVSSFPFPPLYLGDDLAQLAKEDPDLAPFLHQCLLQFVNHEYGHLSSLDLVENFLNRDVHQKSTWMRGNYPSPRWGEIRLEIFYDMGLFHREDTAPRALALEQSRKEKATRPEENP